MFRPRMQIPRLCNVKINKIASYTWKWVSSEQETAIEWDCFCVSERWERKREKQRKRNNWKRNNPTIGTHIHSSSVSVSVSSCLSQSICCFSYFLVKIRSSCEIAFPVVSFSECAHFTYCNICVYFDSFLVASLYVQKLSISNNIYDGLKWKTVTRNSTKFFSSTFYFRCIFCVCVCLRTNVDKDFSGEIW